MDLSWWTHIPRGQVLPWLWHLFQQCSLLPGSLVGAERRLCRWVGAQSLSVFLTGNKRAKAHPSEGCYNLPGAYGGRGVLACLGAEQEVAAVVAACLFAGGRGISACQGAGSDADFHGPSRGGCIAEGSKELTRVHIAFKGNPLLICSQSAPKLLTSALSQSPARADPTGRRATTS